MKISTRAIRDRSSMLVTVRTRNAEHSLRNQVGMGSESDCLFGQLNKILAGMLTRPDITRPRPNLRGRGLSIEAEAERCRPTGMGALTSVVITVSVYTTSALSAGNYSGRHRVASAVGGRNRPVARSVSIGGQMS